MRSTPLALILLGCGPKPAVPPPAAPAVDAPAAPVPAATTWLSTHHVDHPHVGRIWDVQAAAWTDEATLLTAARGARQVLIGEKHDNPDHHALEVRLVTALAGADSLVAFEMIDADVALTGLTSGAEIAQAAGWSTPGWDPDAYTPVADAALAAGATVAGANPPTALVSAVNHGGLTAVPADVRASVPLDAPWPDDWRADAEADIVAAHCNAPIPAAVIAHMAEAQRLKDAHQAATLDAFDGPSVLIAGGGHTRSDRGVPTLLTDDPVVVLLAEVDPEQTDAATETWAADYVWFTPVVTIEDPCEKYRAQLEAMGSGG
jgi:uncharacterized iron-regulated protein